MCGLVEFSGAVDMRAILEEGGSTTTTFNFDDVIRVAARLLRLRMQVAMPPTMPQLLLYCRVQTGRSLVTDVILYPSSCRCICIVILCCQWSTIQTAGCSHITTVQTYYRCVVGRRVN